MAGAEIEQGKKRKKTVLSPPRRKKPGLIMSAC
jgi:hypothetical protein